MIPRSTSVVARRLPPARPGKGTAAIYVAGVNDGSRAAAAAKSGAGGGGGKGTEFGRQRSTGFNTGVHMQKRFDAKEEVSFWFDSSFLPFLCRELKGEESDGRSFVARSRLVLILPTFSYLCPSIRT